MTDHRLELDRFRDRLGVPAVVGAVTDTEAMLFIDTVGVRSRTQPQDMATIDDRWHVGSCGKSITAVLYACLVEDGLARWGTPVRDLFPDIATIDSGWDDPTIEDLLRCRAGVAPNPPATSMRSLYKRVDPALDQRSEATAAVLARAPRKPGSFRYSNLGYVVAGAAIDRLAGMPYEDAMAQWVWRPLGITTAGIGAPPLVRGHRARFRLGPMLAGRGGPALPGGRKPDDNPALLTPAGRWHLSVADWARFHRVFLNDDSALLSRSSIDRLLADPSQGSGVSMSMGWAAGQGLEATHGMQGSNTLWAATALMDRKAGLTAMVVSNDGRTKVLTGSAHLAAQLLKTHRR